MRLKFSIISVFPEAFSSLKIGILGRSLGKIWDLELLNLKTVKKIDDRPAGGGPGMILCCDAIANFESQFAPNRFVLSPVGPTFNQKIASEFAKMKHITLLCGRYEGIDKRVLDYYGFQPISIGDFILAGGEVAASVIVEATVRLLPGIMNNSESTKRESFTDYLLEHDHYTLPRSWRGFGTPQILLSGHEKKINQWKYNSAIKNTKKFRPDLYENFRVRLWCCAWIYFIFKKINKKQDNLLGNS
jgi:tRNA (guanine37-N1)-methyltransferase